MFAYPFLLRVDLYLTMSTQVPLEPGFQFDGQRLRYSTTPDSAASQTSGHLVSNAVHHDIQSFSSATKCAITNIGGLMEHGLETFMSITSVLLC